MLYLIILQLLLFISFPAYVVRKHGVQPSISDSFYAMDKSPVFTLWLCIVGLSMIIPVYFTGNPWFFLSASALCFCGVAAEYQERMTNAVHFIGAAGGVLGAMIGLALEGVYWPAILFICTASGIASEATLKNRVWWIEVLAAGFILTGLVQLSLTLPK